MFNKENQRTVKLTLFTKENGWRKYQIKAIKIAIGDARVSTHVMYPDELVTLGKVTKTEITKITNETTFTSHDIVGYDNPRLHWKPF